MRILLAPFDAELSSPRSGFEAGGDGEPAVLEV